MSEVKVFATIEYTFERRRYGTCQFYTWLMYRVIGSSTWESYGDPWPKPRLNSKELNEALCDCVVKTLKPYAPRYL